MSALRFFTGILATCGAAILLTHLPDARAHQVTGASMAKKSPSNGFTRLPIKKGGSGVALSYRMEDVAEIGKPLTIRLTIFSASDATVTVRAGDGLVLAAQPQVLESAAGQSSEHAVTVTPQAQGRFYLHLISTANGRGSATSIPVQVGKTVVKAKPAGSVQVTPNGERIISVPAK